LKLLFFCNNNKGKGQQDQGPDRNQGDKQVNDPAHPVLKASTIFDPNDGLLFSFAEELSTW
jgi:hypothetical protein